jgi:FkbM family methyltransferase
MIEIGLNYKMASTEQLLKKLLKKNIVNSLIHVGGHKGEEIEFYSSYDLSKVIYFEPIKAFYQEIYNQIDSKNLNNFQVFNLALGSENKKEEIYVADGNSSGSSSLLEPRPSDISFSQKELIEIRTYDSMDIMNIDLAVLDTQGYELEVLKGMNEKLSQFKYLIVEFSVFEGYLKQVVFTDLDAYLGIHSFTRIKTIRKLNHKKYNDSNYGDAIYINNEDISNLKKVIYNIKTRFIDSRLFIQLLIISDFSFHVKKLKEFIKKLIRKN